MLESTDPAVQLIFSTATITILDSSEYVEYTIGISCTKSTYHIYNAVNVTSMRVNILTLL